MSCVVELCEAIAAIICNLVIRLVHLTKSRAIVNVAIFAVRISNIYNLNCTNLDDEFYEAQNEQKDRRHLIFKSSKICSKNFSEVTWISNRGSRKTIALTSGINSKLNCIISLFFFERTKYACTLNSYSYLHT